MNLRTFIPKVGLALLIVGGCIGLFLVGLLVYARTLTISGSRQSHDEAVRVFPLMTVLPECARDICYAGHPHGDSWLVLDFAIEENEFLVWAQRRNWVLAKIERDKPVVTLCARGEITKEVVVEQGYEYHCSTHRGHFHTEETVVYDLAAKRVYYKSSYSTY